MGEEGKLRLLIRVVGANIGQINVISDDWTKLAQPFDIACTGVLFHTAQIRFDEESILAVPEEGPGGIIDEYALGGAVFVHCSIPVYFLISGKEGGVKIFVAVPRPNGKGAVARLQKEPVLRVGILLLPSDEENLRLIARVAQNQRIILRIDRVD